MHHVIPKSEGGTTTVPLCVSCHSVVHDARAMSTPHMTHKGLLRSSEYSRLLMGVVMGQIYVPTHKYSFIESEWGISREQIGRYENRINYSARHDPDWLREVGNEYAGMVYQNDLMVSKSRFFEMLDMHIDSPDMAEFAFGIERKQLESDNNP